jgi:hypothetical protein
MEAPLKRLKSIKTGELPLWFFSEKIIIICKCNKCGKLKKFVEENP